jgi:UDP-N-acetylmuramoyl-tripeptide--D-alanyl-D-alanine ligase
MAAALNVLAERSCKGRRVAVLGDMLELGSSSMAEHYRIGRMAVGKVDMIFAYGVNATRVVTGAVTGGMDPNKAMYYDDQDQLIHELKARVRPGDTLLFKGSRGMKMERVLDLFLKDDIPD